MIHALAYQRLKSSRLTVLSFWIIVGYFLVAILVKFGWLAGTWDETVGGSYQAPSIESMKVWFGTDIFGRSVFLKTIYGIYTAVSVGFVGCAIAIPIGVFLGAVAGYFGGKIDDLIVWFYTTISSIPSIMLLVAVAFVMGKGVLAVYFAIGLTFWVGLARVIRAEFLKHKEREYVVAAQALGASHFARIFKHILPNVSHQVIIYFSLMFQSAIKYEVILSYLGLGVQGQPSWGVMIDDARQELFRNPMVWWQLTGATVAMFVLVLAFNLFGDSLRDALDPKLK